jgi:hypothetical protein
VSEAFRIVALAAPLAAGLAASLNAAPALAEVIDGRIPLVEPAAPANEPSPKDDPIVTGSLSQPPVRTLKGFADHVSAGTIQIRESTPTQCLPGNLKEVLASVSARFGPVSIQSTHRPTAMNRRKGGARNSLHIACRAIDFRVRAARSGVMAFLRSRPEVGGLKVYRNGIIHIDNGERRTW